MEPTVRLLCSLTSFFYPLCECKIHVRVGTGLLSECNCCCSVSGLALAGQKQGSARSPWWDRHFAGIRLVHKD